MAKHHAACCFAMASCLLTFVLPTPSLQLDSTLSSPRLLSFQLHLHSSTPLNLQDDTRQPFSPYLFSDQPLFHFDNISHAHTSLGSACGLYLAHPAASMDLHYIFFTASLQNHQGGHIASTKEGENDINDVEGSLVLMGNLSSGAISIIGGTGAFAFASGQANVSIGAAGSKQLVISFDAELRQYHEQQESIL